MLFLGSSLFTTLHGLIVIALATFWSVTPRPVVHTAYLGVYIVGSEVLWRMNGSNLFWETGKYALILIFMLGILRDRHAKFGILPALYFLFLLPAVIPTISELGIAGARNQISSNLSGPLAITVAAWFFAQIKLSQKKSLALE